MHSPSRNRVLGGLPAETCENDLMPAKHGRDEQVFVKLFVSACENFAWVGSKIDPLDERFDGAIEALVTRADGQMMAIEHTLIEPFVGDKRDYAIFEQAFLGIEEDKSLAVPDTGTILYVPVGILDGQKPAKRDAIVESIHSWIARNRLQLREGIHRYECDVHGMPPVTLNVKRNKFRLSRRGPGSVLVRRQQMTNDLDKVIERALRKKLPKLVTTTADRHVLFLERDQFTFDPDLIFAEIERQRPKFPSLEEVDEIWHLETIFSKQGGYLYFELRNGDQLQATIEFANEVLVGHCKDGVPYSM
jgi:hypothetical protein